MSVHEWVEKVYLCTLSFFLKVSVQVYTAKVTDNQSLFVNRDLNATFYPLYIFFFLN